MQPLSTFLTPTICLFLSLAVVISGLHAKELAGIAAQSPHLDAKVDSHTNSELHHHIDKQTLKTLQTDTLQVDSRSLRLIKKTINHKAEQWRERVASWLGLLAHASRLL